MKSIDGHFSTIAHKYRDLRTTDLEPILSIREELQGLQKIEAADFGCGAGRYVLKLFEHLGDRLLLHCADSNKEMLQHLRDYLTRHGIEDFHLKQHLAEDLPIRDESLDCVFTFNAIHLFKIRNFLNETVRVLRDGGYLFIYTRLRSQNMGSIWGRHFPLFSQKEDRLYESEELKSIVGEIPGLEVQNFEFFKYQRVSSLNWLVKQARNHHYSTFNFYAEDEFGKSLNEFKQNLRQHFEDTNNISWLDGNVLLVARKRRSQALA